MVTPAVISLTNGENPYLKLFSYHLRLKRSESLVQLMRSYNDGCVKCLIEGTSSQGI